ncbi:hypothetical protein Hanom_Chr04g00340591 [Helianthus anomalus]
MYGAYIIVIYLKKIFLAYDLLVATMMLHTKRENSTQKTSLVGERAHLIYKLRIICPYKRYGTSPIPCNGISP